MKNQTYRMTMLLDFYGEILTQRQREFFDLYYNEDLSLAEIAENYDISRQGVRDAIVRAEAAMNELEDKTGLLKRCMRLRESFLSWRRSDWMADAPFDVVGPAAANVVKVMNRYRYALTLGGRDSKKLREMIRYVILRAKEDKQNRVSSITVDRNPMDSF